MMTGMDREKWIKGIKFTTAAIAAILLGELLGLKYAATAGIITILSIQNTKKETLQVAGRRAAAFVCALLLSAVCFGLLGFTIPAFAVYLFGFSCICLRFRWPEAISMDSVLISHFLAEKSMAPELLINECLLFVIGAGLGILANLHLHRNADEFERLAERADAQMCRALGLVRGQVSGTVSEQDAKDGLAQLECELKALQECAHRNWNNTVLENNSCETDYADMRSGQARVLQHISASAALLEQIPSQARITAQLLKRVEAEYAKDNPVKSLLDHMEEVYDYMRHEELPQTREEFESRAVLFYVLKQIEEFLWIKRNFVLKQQNGPEHKS